MSFTGLPGRGTLISWALGTVVAPSEFFWFESCIVNAIDGGAGGAYAPSAAIVVGGAGMQFTGLLSISATGSVSISAGSGTFTCSRAATFAGISATSLFCNGDASFQNGTLYVASSGVLHVDGPTELAGGVSISGSVYIADGINTPLHFGNGGYLRRRRLRITAGGAGQTVSLEYHDIVFDTIAGDLILADYGGDGAILSIVNESASNVILKKEGTMEQLGIVATLTRIEMMRDPTVAVGWRICGRMSL